MAEGSTQDGSALPNLRKAFRRRTLKSARIIFNLGRSSLSVQILNMSDSGAKVRLFIPWPCPQKFDLEIINGNTSKPVLKRCILQWQRGELCGVEFV
jgi:hypothetical protein